MEGKAGNEVIPPRAQAGLTPFHLDTVTLRLALASNLAQHRLSQNPGIIGYGTGDADGVPAGFESSW